MGGKITFNDIDILLNRGFTTWFPKRMQKRLDGQADSGVKQFYNFFDQWVLECGIENVVEHIQEFIAFNDWAKSGQTFSIERDRTLGCYIAFEGDLSDTGKKGLYTNDREAGTFTRSHVADAASYIDVDGVLKYQNVANLPRLCQGKYGRGVLIEKSSTNIITRSETIGGTGWTIGGVGHTVTQDSTDMLGPDNENESVTKFVTGGSGNACYFDTGVAISTDDGVFSIYIRSASGDIGSIDVNILNDSSLDTLATTTVTATPEWQRFYVAFGNGGSDAEDWLPYLNLPASKTIYFACAQMEVGADVLYPSAYIKADSGSTVTRAVETLTYSTDNILNTLPQKGTLSAWIKPSWDPDDQEGTILFEIDSDNTGGIMLKLGIDADGDYDIAIYGQNNSSYATITSAAISHFSADTWTHVCFTWDSLLETDTALIRLYIDGAFVASDGSSEFSIATGHTTFSIGSDTSGSNQTSAIFDEVAIFKIPLTATEISNIYNLGYPLNIGRNRFDSLYLSNPNLDPVWQLSSNKGKQFWNLDIIAEEVLT